MTTVFVVILGSGCLSWLLSHYLLDKWLNHLFDVF